MEDIDDQEEEKKEWKDDTIECWIRRRDEYRRSERFEEADDIRKILFEKVGIVLTDDMDHLFPPENRRWMRIKRTVEEGEEDKYSLYTIKETGCLVWTHRKRSFCGKPRSKGEWFCSEHTENGLKGRVPCPLDCRHHVKLSAVGSHVLVCEKSPGVPSLGGTTRKRRNEEDEKRANELCRDIEYVRSLKDKLERAFERLKRFDAKTDDEVEVEEDDEVTTKTTYRTSSRGSNKTSDQQCILIANQLRRQLDATLRNVSHAKRVALVEFCAGKARLSEIVCCRLFSDRESAAVDVILLDRCRSRNKADGHIVADTVKRMTIDIGDVKIAELDAVKRAARSEGGVVCAVGKHWYVVVAVVSLSLSCAHARLLFHALTFTRLCSCGTAGDLTVRSCLEIAKAGSRVCCAFALCCHHLCEWSTVSSRNVLEAAGIDALDFLCMRKLSIKSLAPTEIGRVGRLVKRLINELRVHSLVASGSFRDARIVTYCDPSVSPENQLLVARAGHAGSG